MQIETSGRQEQAPLVVGRRAIVAGAAWTVPVIASVVVAPLGTASPICPTLPPLGTWARQVPLSGTPGLGAAQVRTRQGREELYVRSEAVPGTGNLVLRFSTTFNAVAGRKYNFSFSYGSNYGENIETTSTRAQVRLEVGPAPAVLFNGSTRPLQGFTTIPTNSNGAHTNYGNANPAYTATTTGPITVAYVFVMTANSATHPYTDDISITRPTITCS